MDPVTHTLSGFVVGKTITKNKTIFAIILVASILPDIDIILRFHSRELFLMYHRGITHGIGALFLFPLLPGIIFRKKLGFLKAYASAFIAYAVHLFLDLTNQYGTKILSPFDWNSYSLSLTFIVDPYVLLPLLTVVVLSIKFKKHAKFLYIFSIVFIALYIATKAYLKAEARAFLKQNIEAHQYRVYPLPNDFLRWWFVTRHSDEYITGFVDLFTKRVCVDEKYRIKNDPAIIKSKEAEAVKALLSFAKHPIAQLRHEGDVTVVIWKELSYGFLPNDRFTAKVWLKETPQGYKIINATLKI
ncbi:metal-dependent hydrolase [Thermodesulfovibrio sp. 3907-1M]|uniref:Metal-dependent hydrolase n=1 Tax=Thermodesulfovibrio autotrophicus TaxID=3118333 RepID=A0AAU8GTI2_9BACT